MASSTRRIFTYILPVILILFSSYGQTGDIRSITPSELDKWLKEKPETVVLLDVRTEQEHAEGHIPGTDLNIDYRQLREKKDQLPADPEALMVVYCRSGRRSKIAYETLLEMGYTNVYNLEGGILRWMEEGYPVNRSGSSSGDDKIDGSVYTIILIR